MDVTETESIDHLNNELDRLLDRFIAEHDVSTAAVAGALFIKAALVATNKDVGEVEDEK